jgi:hypothetical protein
MEEAKEEASRPRDVASRCKEVVVQDIRRIWIGKASRSKGGAI